MTIIGMITIGILLLVAGVFFFTIGLRFIGLFLFAAAFAFLGCVVNEVFFSPLDNDKKS